MDFDFVTLMTKVWLILEKGFDFGGGSRRLSLLPLQTVCGVHPACCSMST